ncbi:MAG: FAD-dependent oxidoreductase [Chloroflexi bacterium]|nr:FAD-dependent oxidoreductase [Chloroflexota bacterium]
MSQHWAEKSFWLATAGDYQPDPPLEGDTKVDVAVVGGGFCGLSTAYYLKRAEPSLRVAVLEQEVVGYGASGRNAGFAMTLMGMTLGLTALRFGKEKTKQAHDFAHRAVDHIGQLVDAHGIDCDYEKPGLLTVALNPGQAKRLQGEVRLAESLGMQGLRWLDMHEVRAQVHSPMYLGARWEEQCALINPAKFVRGMKRVAQEQGVEVYETTPVTAFHHRPVPRLETPRGNVEAEKVVFATNAFSACFPQLAAKQYPVFTYIVLTEPLSEERLQAIGWKSRQGIEDGRNFIHYYRLTADNRLLFGGADAQYYFGAPLDRDQSPRVFRMLEQDLARMFPPLKDARIDYRWGGPVSVPLDFFPAFGYLGKDKRVAYALGCMGHGVALMNMAGHIMRDLVLERESEFTELFFVNRTVIPLPPEPIRWALGETIRQALKLQDRWEAIKESKVEAAAG